MRCDERTSVAEIQAPRLRGAYFDKFKLIYVLFRLRVLFLILWQVQVTYIIDPIRSTDSWESVKAREAAGKRKILTDLQVIQGGGTGKALVGMIEDQLLGVGVQPQWTQRKHAAPKALSEHSNMDPNTILLFKVHILVHWFIQVYAFYVWKPTRNEKQFSVTNNCDLV